MRARAKTARLGTQYKSGAESQFATIARRVLKDELGGDVALLAYEPVTFNLPGGRYTPDFQAIMSDGSIVFIEVKGGKRQRGYRDARSKLRAAAALWPCYLWIEWRADSVTLEVINKEF